MSRNTTTPSSGTGHLHRESWELLPWLVTGRLGEADRARVEGHLAECAECRAELETQRTLHDSMSAEDRVAYSPAASFEKLWSRIEELEREVPSDAVADSDHLAHAPASSLRTHPRASHTARFARWLVAAVVVQAIAIGWLASTVVSWRVAPPWQFRTVTSAPVSIATTPGYRVVFAPEVSVGELQRILAAHGLVIVQTSPMTEVITVAPVAAPETVDAVAVLEGLRREPSVRFVEITAGRSAP